MTGKIRSTWSRAHTAGRPSISPQTRLQLWHLTAVTTCLTIFLSMRLGSSWPNHPQSCHQRLLGGDGAVPSASIAPIPAIAGIGIIFMACSITCR